MRLSVRWSSEKGEKNPSVFLSSLLWESVHMDLVGQIEEDIVWLRGQDRERENGKTETVLERCRNRKKI